jgi:hypothetical protein
MEVITGWRMWAIGGGRLIAISQETPWPVRQVFQAVCEGGDNHSGPAPDRDCNCGIWAFKTMEDLVAGLNRDHVHDLRVFGKVALWGRVIETTKGYRAEKAYPTELWLMKPGLEQLGATYNVPVRSL